LRSGEHGVSSESSTIGLTYFENIMLQVPFFGEDEEEIIQQVKWCKVEYPSNISLGAISIISRVSTVIHH